MSDAKMQFLGSCDGVNWYWAEPGNFENPGVYFWNGKENVRCIPNSQTESRTVTVKLPHPGFITISGERMAVYLKGDVDAAMLAAGIEEAE